MTVWYVINQCVFLSNHTDRSTGIFRRSPTWKLNMWAKIGNLNIHCKETAVKYCLYKYLENYKWSFSRTNTKWNKDFNDTLACFCDFLFFQFWSPDRFLLVVHQRGLFKICFFLLTFMEIEDQITSTGWMQKLWKLLFFYLKNWNSPELQPIPLQEGGSFRYCAST